MAKNIPPDARDGRESVAKRASLAQRQRGPRDDRGVLADRILDSARTLFAEQGFASTSLRQIAEAAEVDTALVSYYFGSKAGLFDAVLTLPAQFVDEVAVTAATPIRSRGAAIVAHHLRAWDDPTIASVFGSIMMAAAQDATAMVRLREIFAGGILNAVSAQLPSEERDLRASLVSAQLIGLAMSRYVWKVGALAELPSERVIALVAPTIQRYLTGSLP